jgi:hypothetical protein
MRESRGTERAHARTRRIRHVGMRHRVAGVIGALLVIGGGSALGYAISGQQHAPQPSASAAGSTGPAGTRRDPAATVLSLPRSEPVSIDIPAIGVRSKLLHLGLNPNGTIQVPPLFALPSEAAWYKYSPTPGQIGSSIIEGHVDTYKGPSVFFRLGALVPGDTVNVTLADGTVAVFRVTGVRLYPKTNWPWQTIFAQTHYAGLHLITCGGAFDYNTGHYLSNTVVFASLVGAKRPSSTGNAASQSSQGGLIAAPGGSAN